MDDQNQNYDQHHEELTRVVEPEVHKMGAVQRIINLFVSPSELMQNIKVYPVILIPLIVSMAIGLISVPLTSQIMPIVQQELSIISIDRYGIDLMNLGAQGDIYGDFNVEEMDTFLMISSVIGAIITPLIISFILALGMLVLSKIARGDATFGQLLSMYMHIYIIIILGELIVSGLMVTTGNFLNMTSLAAVFMPQGNIAMVSFNVLSSISIFTVWVAVLTFIGVKILNQFGNIKAGILAGIAFFVGMAFQVGSLMANIIIWDMMFTQI